MKKNHIIFMLIFFAFTQQGHTMMGHPTMTDNSMTTPGEGSKSIKNAQENVTMTKEQQLQNIIARRMFLEKRDVMEKLCQAKKKALSSSKEKSQKQKEIDAMKKKMKSMDGYINKIDLKLSDIICTRAHQIPMDRVLQIGEKEESLVKKRRKLINKQINGENTGSIKKHIRKIDEKIICTNLELEEQLQDSQDSSLAWLNLYQENGEPDRYFITENIMMEYFYKDIVKNTKDFPDVEEVMKNNEPLFEEVFMNIKKEKEELIKIQMEEKKEESKRFAEKQEEEKIHHATKDLFSCPKSKEHEKLIHLREKIMGLRDSNIEQQILESAEKIQLASIQEQGKNINTLAALQRKKYDIIKINSREQMRAKEKKDGAFFQTEQNLQKEASYISEEIKKVTEEIKRSYKEYNALSQIAKKIENLEKEENALIDKRKKFLKSEEWMSPEFEKKADELTNAIIIIEKKIRSACCGIKELPSGVWVEEKEDVYKEAAEEEQKKQKLRNLKKKKTKLSQKIQKEKEAFYQEKEFSKEKITRNTRIEKMMNDLEKIEKKIAQERSGVKDVPPMPHQQIVVQEQDFVVADVVEEQEVMVQNAVQKEEIVVPSLLQGKEVLPEREQLYDSKPPMEENKKGGMSGKSLKEQCKEILETKTKIDEIINSTEKMLIDESSDSKNKIIISKIHQSMLLKRQKIVMPNVLEVEEVLQYLKQLYDSKPPMEENKKGGGSEKMHNRFEKFKRILEEKPFCPQNDEKIMKQEKKVVEEIINLRKKMEKDILQKAKIECRAMKKILLNSQAIERETEEEIQELSSEIKETMKEIDKLYAEIYPQESTKKIVERHVHTLLRIRENLCIHLPMKSADDYIVKSAKLEQVDKKIQKKRAQLDSIKD